MQTWLLWKQKTIEYHVSQEDTEMLVYFYYHFLDLTNRAFIWKPTLRAPRLFAHECKENAVSLFVSMAMCGAAFHFDVFDAIFHFV